MVKTFQQSRLALTIVLFSSRIIWPFLAVANLNGSSSVSWKDHELLRAGGQPERAQLAERPRVFPGRQAEQLLAAVRKRENVDLVPGKKDSIAWWFNFSRFLCISSSNTNIGRPV